MRAGTRVTIIQPAILHYRRRFYELLRERLTAEGTALVLIHSNPLDGYVWENTIDLPWACRVRESRLRVGGNELSWQHCHHLLRGSDLVIVEQGSRHLLNYVLAFEQLLGIRRLCLWGHGKSFAARPSRTAEWAKARLTRVAHWWFAYTDLSAEVAASAGFPRERITVVQNTVDTTRLRRAVDALDDAQVSTIRGELGVRSSRVGLFIGSLAPTKRLDYLFAAADVVRATTGDFQLILAGTGSEEPAVEAFARARPWVRYLGPCFEEDKAALLAIADVLIMPAWAGLVVLDAFAAGLPIVVSASQPHPPEVTYLNDGVNGLVVRDGGSPTEYGRAVAKLLDDPATRHDLAARAQAASSRYTIEEMADRFASGIRDAIALRR